MLRYWARCALAAAALAAQGLASSHQGENGQAGQDGVDDMMLDCERLPPQAVSSLPQPVAAWTQLSCRQTGQLLVESPAWQWRYPASFTTPVMVSAAMASPHAAGARYFTAVTVATQEGEAAARLHDQLAREVLVYADYAGARAPDSAYTLVASNDLGDRLLVHFLPRGTGEFLGVVCAPKCIPEATFIVQKRGG